MGSLKAVVVETEVPEYHRLSLFGHAIHTMGDTDVIDLIGHAAASQRQILVGNHNLHSMYLCQQEPRMLEFYAAADYVLIDGMSLILLGRMLGSGLQRNDRATSLDFMPMLLPEAVRRGWRIYFLGSKPEVAARAGEKLREQYPGLQLRTRHGYFHTDTKGRQNQEVIRDINNFSPHVLFVGMGMPRQELWILDNHKQIQSNIIFPFGAHMDYVAQQIPTAPRWLADLYIEWLYRLVAEPGRLWRRYLVEPWSVLSHFAAYQLGRRYRALGRKSEEL